MSKHKPISDHLRAEIKAGKYPLGRRLPSEEALCRHWKVSRPTVSRALRDLTLEGIVERRVGAGTFVSGDLKPLHTIIGLLVDGLGKTEILDPVCAEITRAAQQRNCSIITGGLPQDHSPVELASQWAAGGVRGVIFAPLENIKDRQAFNMEVAKCFLRVNITVVLVDRDATDFPRRSDFDLIEMDNFHAGYDLGQHLVSVGAKKVVFVARPHFPSSTDERLVGLTNALLRSELPAPRFLVGNPEDASLVRQFKSDSENCDACVCSNDLTAAKVLQTAQSLGFRVPQDFLLAGFDDVGFASLLSVPLTTIRQPCRDIGVACVDTLLGRMLHAGLPARSILLRGELVTRKSTSLRPAAKPETWRQMVERA